ncbi:hypothetical protein TNCV_3141751 [Trichonephila clavipes]|nr:hypothetical protein TNCV_3141751 [Trichonephila clavipes]
MISRQTDHLTGTSAQAPQRPRSRILRWAEQALAPMDCCVTEFNFRRKGKTILSITQCGNSEREMPT